MGTIGLDFLCSISYATSNKFDGVGKGYRKTQGYTVGESNSQVVIGLNSSNQGCFLKFKNNGVYETAKAGLNLGHGNGCTYYDGYYYVAIGYHEAPSPVIKRYDKNFNFDRQYKCLKEYDVPFNVASITHMSGDYFIVAAGDDAYVCKKYDAAPGETYYGGFVKYSELKLKNDTVTNAFNSEGATLVSQSIYYDKNDKTLYRVVSYERKIGNNKDIINRNGIAKYSLSGGAPSYNTATFQGLYTCSSDLPLFELEAMSSNSSGQKYVSTNAKYFDDKTGDEKDCDAIYKVFL